MFNNSVITKTGQLWKATLSFVLLICGSVLGYYGISHGALPIACFGGLALIAVSLIFPCLSIRCSMCGARWVWLALKQQNSNSWLFWLFGQAECPVCKGR